MRIRIVIAVLAIGALVVSTSFLLAQAPQDQGLTPPPGGLNTGRLSGTGKGKGKQRGPSRPTPHWPDGRVNFGPIPGEKGVWEGNAGATLATNTRGLDNPTMNLSTNLKIDQVPFQPWARGVYDYRQSSTTKDDPHVRCAPSGGPRAYHTPYGMEFVEQRETETVFILGVGGPHTWRAIYMDGREHPSDFDPSFYGHSTGHWDGDSLVVDTVGFNERFWLTREGIPLTQSLHLIEKFTRTDYDTMTYVATLDDPGAYTKPWSGGWYLRWQNGEEMYEYICQDNNRDPKHMYGGPRD